MNYKDLFHIAFLLISSPARAWEEIRVVEDKRKVLMDFVYPMIGLCGVSVFIGSLWTMGWGGPESFRYAMTQCCAVAVSLFGGCFLSAYLINKLGVRFCTLYVVWEGCMPVMQVRERYRLRFTVMASLVLILCPWVIDWAFTRLTVVLS